MTFDFGLTEHFSLSLDTGQVCSHCPNAAAAAVAGAAVSMADGGGVHVPNVCTSDAICFPSLQEYRSRLTTSQPATRSFARSAGRP